MKKKDIWISLVIIAVSGGVLYYYTRGMGMGYIRVDAGGIDATLQLHSSLFGRTTIISNQKPAAVRARVNRPRHLRLSIDRKGPKCLLDSQGPWGEYSKIGVKNKETTIVKFGPPFFIEPTVYKKEPLVRLINFSIVGRAGEKYQYANRGSKPKARIIDENGNVLALGNFQFG